VSRAWPLVRAAAAVISFGRRGRFSPGDVARIWVHKPDHLGDAILVRPALAALRATFPNATITLACHPDAAPLFADDSLMIETVAFDSPFLGGADRLSVYRRAVRTAEPDLLVNLRHDFRDVLLCLAVRAPALVTYDHRGLARRASHPGSPPGDTSPEADNHLRLLTETLGLAPAPTPPPAYATDPAPAWDELPDRPCVVFHAAARSPAKLWPVASWRTLITMMAEAGLPRPALVGGLSDRALGQQIAHGLPVADWTGRFTLREAAAHLAQADAVVGVDSGPGHLAAAAGVPVVSLMSGTNRAERWAPDVARALTHPVDCAPCQRERCPVLGHPCLAGVAPDAVLAALQKAVAQ
jgi:ADP-heptose:LPS heptosyltransferase